jgi:hypothetical protein
MAKENEKLSGLNKYPGIFCTFVQIKKMNEK